MGPYSSERILYWGNREHKYRAFYCDSLQPTGCGEAGTGGGEGKDLVFESTTQGPAGVLEIAERFSNISNAGFTFSLDLVNQGKRERSVTIQARRKGASAGTIPPGDISPAVKQTATSGSESQLNWVATPGREVQLLSDALVGKWTTSERFEPDASHKNGATGTGTFSIRKGPGGNSLILGYTSRSSMGPYSSSRIIYWDRREQKYRAFYCDSLQPTGCGEAGSGRWDGKDLTFESMIHESGSTVPITERFSDISDKGFVFSLNLVNHGKPERSLTIEAHRNGAQP